MKKTISTVTLILMLILFTGISIWIRPLLLKPHLVVENLNLESLMPGQEIERAVRLENKGFSKLIISDVKTCCGVTLPYGYPKQIPARSVDFALLKVKVPLSNCEFDRRVEFHSNSSHSLVSNFHILGKPKNLIQIDPMVVNLGFIHPKEGFFDISSILVNDKSNKIELVNAVTSNPNIFAEIEMDDNTEKGKLRLAFSNKMAYGKFEDFVYIKTNNTEQPNLVIPVSGNFEKGLIIRPHCIFFGKIKNSFAKKTQNLKITILESAWQDFEVSVERNCGISVKLEKIGNSHANLSVNLSPSNMPKVLETKVKLINPSGDLIELPIIAVNDTCNCNYKKCRP